jgi:Secretion system C-terminal sorting domain/Carbohydrate binding domain
MMKKFTFLFILCTLFSLTLGAQNYLGPYNPSFEDFDTSATGAVTNPCRFWNTQVDTSGAARGAITFTTLNPKDGKRAARAQVDAINPGTQWHVQLLQFDQYSPLKILKAGSTDTQFYSIRFWAKAATAGSKFNVVVQQGAAGNFDTPFERTITATTSWVQYKFDFKITKEGDFRPAFHFGLETGTFFVDLVEWGKMGEIDNVVTVVPKNLMEPYNPEFESYSDAAPFPSWFMQVDSSGTNTARGNITNVNTGAQKGARCAKIEVKAITADKPYNIQAVNNPYATFKKLKDGATTDQSYTLAFWAKADVAGKKVNALVQNASFGTSAAPGSQEMTLTTTWARYIYTFTVTKDDLMRPAVHLGIQTGTYFLDNFELGKTEDIVTTTPVLPKNLMETNNPEFETYSAADPFPSWFMQVDSSGASTARGAITNENTGAQKGARCLKAVVTGVTVDKPYNIQAVHNPFYQFTKLKAGATTDQSYTLAFWAKADVAGKKINALIQNSSFGTSALPASQEMVLTTTWARYLYTFTLSKDDMMHPVVHMGLEKGTYFLDNFEVGKTEDIVTTPVVLPKNLMEPNNPEFEVYSAADPFPSWFTQVDSSGTSIARGNITNVNTGAQKGTRCLKADVTAVSALPYNIQAVHNPFYSFTKLKTGGTTDQSYTLSFWAKADAAGKKINALIQNAAFGTVATPASKEMVLTASWARYLYTFTVTKDDMMHPAIHLGIDKGVYLLDNFELGKTEDIVSGTTEIIINNNVLVYPNPTSGAFQISSPEVFESLEVYDLTGKMMQKFKGNANNQYDVSGLPNGIYQLAARSKEGISVSRIVKF